MTIILYTNNSEPVKLQKDLTELLSTQGSLKEGATILNPDILINITDASLLSTCNYAYIEEFKRYYFITDITVERNTQFRFTMHVDVLGTYADYLLQLNAVIARQENEYNLYLNDPCFRVEQRTRHKVINFPNEFNDSQFILAIAGSGD